MNTTSKLFLLSFILVSCGQEHNYYQNGDTPKEATTSNRGDSSPTTSRNFSYDLLSPQKNDIAGISFDQRGKLLSPKDKRYTRFEVKKNTQILELNNINFPAGVREIEIQGKYIVIDSKVDYQGIYKLLNNQNDLYKVVFNVETLEIKSALKIPSANMTINARELIVSGNGQINLTPNSIQTKAEQFKNGKNGIHGSSLVLNLGSLNTTKSATSPLFILQGGNGQDAGAGQDGAQGQSLRDLGGGVVYRETTRAHCYWERPDIGGRFENKFWDCTWSNKTREGSPTWPGNGSNARAGGKPGLPGNGGLLLSNVKIEQKLINLRGGISGKEASNYQGGAAGTPVNSYHKRIHIGSHTLRSHESQVHHLSHKGADATSPKIEKAIGDLGKFKIEKTAGWYNLGYLEFNKKYARDLYKVNLLENAQATYKDMLENCKTLDKQKSQLSFYQEICQNGVKQSQQITSNLDYYGNKSSWTPNLSFEANFQLYNTEIDRSINILYMTRFLLGKHQSLENKQTAIESNQREHIEQVNEDEKSFNDLIAKIPGLKTKVANFKVEEKQFTEELARVEAQIIAEANHNVNQRHKVPFFKKAVKMLGVISKVVPVGQPALGAIGISLNAVADGLDSDKPWQTALQTIPDLANSLDFSKIEKIRKSWNTTREKIDFSEFQRIFKLNPKNSGYTEKEIKKLKMDYFKNLRKFSAPIVKGLASYASQNSKVRVPKGEVEKEIQKIKNSHPLFNELTKKLRSLIAKRKEISEQISGINTLLGDITERITNSYVNIAKLAELSADLEEGIDTKLKSTLGNIEDAAKERLAKYNYFLAKAYQYRMLESFPGNLDLEPVLDRIEKLVKNGAPEQVPPRDFDEIKGIYEDQISKVVNSIVDEFNSGRLFHSNTDRSFNLRSDQIAALNAGHTIYLDLASKNIFGNDSNNAEVIEDIRINKIEVGGMDFELNGDPEVIAEGTLEIAYSGKSFIKKDDQYYFFEFGDTNSQQRLRWGAKKNILLNTTSPIKPSYNDQSLLRSILDSDEYVMLFARPGALTQLKLKLVKKVDEGASIKLKNASIKINYDFVKK